MENRKLFNVVLWILVATLILVVFLGVRSRTSPAHINIDDGTKQIDLNTIYLEDSAVEVNFSEILLSKQSERRKLMVADQKASVTITLTDRLVKTIDANFMKKTQTVSYTGTGYFVVDLDDLTAENIVDDKENKILTIKIGHAYLEDIAINPEDVIIDEVKQSILARGDIELTLADFNAIEKELVSKINAKLNTVPNIQNADKIALKEVKAIYEPIVKAIDQKYTVVVEFK